MSLRALIQQADWLIDTFLIEIIGISFYLFMRACIGLEIGSKGHL